MKIYIICINKILNSGKNFKNYNYKSVNANAKLINLILFHMRNNLRNHKIENNCTRMKFRDCKMNQNKKMRN